MNRASYAFTMKPSRRDGKQYKRRKNRRCCFLAQFSSRDYVFVIRDLSRGSCGNYSTRCNVRFGYSIHLLLFNFLPIPPKSYGLRGVSLNNDRTDFNDASWTRKNVKHFISSRHENCNELGVYGKSNLLANIIQTMLYFLYISALEQFQSSVKQ